MSKARKSNGNEHGLTRRGLMATASFAAMSLAMPRVLRAQGQSVKIGVLHPVTGALAYEGEQCRKGALLAIEEINAAGGIKSMGGAKIEAVLADAQSKPDVGAAEIDRLAEAGVLAVQGPFASGIALATTQAAAKHNLPHLVDVGVVDADRDARASNHVPLRAGLRQDHVVRAGCPAEDQRRRRQSGQDRRDRARGRRVRLGHGEASEREAARPRHPGAADAQPSDAAARLHQHRAADPAGQSGPDHPVELQERVHPDGAHAAAAARQAEGRRSTPCSAAPPRTSRFAKQYPEAAEYIMDCNHWYNPTKELSKAFAKKVADKGWDLTYEVMLNYSCMRVLADALERASAPTAPRSTRRSRPRPTAITSCPMARPSSSTDRTRARSRPIRRS